MSSASKSIKEKQLPAHSVSIEINSGIAAVFLRQHGYYIILSDNVCDQFFM